MLQIDAIHHEPGKQTGLDLITWLSHTTQILSD